MKYMMPPQHEPGRSLHRMDPEGFEVVDTRIPQIGELFADCRGASAWIWTTTGTIHTPQLIVAPTKKASYP